jgi:pimeloyl-CoA synthetase
VAFLSTQLKVSCELCLFRSYRKQTSRWSQKGKRFLGIMPMKEKGEEAGARKAFQCAVVLTLVKGKKGG